MSVVVVKMADMVRWTALTRGTKDTTKVMPVSEQNPVLWEMLTSSKD